MSNLIRHRLMLGAVAISCVGAGAGASVIADAGAHPRASKSHAARPGLALRKLARRVVQGNLVVATKAGFATVRVDRGTVKSVSGQQLTLAVGTRKATYDTVTLTLPNNVRVREDRAKATLSAVKANQRATVVIGPNRALVVAHTP
jgi:hypothetical protein